MIVVQEGSKYHAYAGGSKVGLKKRFETHLSPRGRLVHLKQYSSGGLFRLYDLLERKGGHIAGLATLFRFRDEDVGSGSIIWLTEDIAHWMCRSYKRYEDINPAARDCPGPWSPLNADCPLDQGIYYSKAGAKSQSESVDATKSNNRAEEEDVTLDRVEDYVDAEEDAEIEELEAEYSKVEAEIKKLEAECAEEEEANEDDPDEDQDAEVQLKATRSITPHPLVLFSSFVFLFCDSGLHFIFGFICFWLLGVEESNNWRKMKFKSRQIVEICGLSSDSNVMLKSQLDRNWRTTNLNVRVGTLAFRSRCFFDPRWEN